MRAWLIRQLLHPLAPWVLGLLSALPACALVWAAAHDSLGANPAEALIRQTGDWTLRFLCFVLALTPLRMWTGVGVVLRFRRQIGLTVYAYAVLHLLCYAWLDMGLELADIAHDIAKRPFIWVGFSAFVLLSLLAATSFNRAMRMLGRAWRRLHQSVYLIAVLAVLHFFWMRASKNNLAEVAVYAALLALLLGARVGQRVRGAAPQRTGSDQ